MCLALKNFVNKSYIYTDNLQFSLNYLTSVQQNIDLVRKSQLYYGLMLQIIMFEG
ncbi:hypothetical protein GPUN_0146 [Glaciecola punicea ACAM 611]|uniref:Uncharacterized protein n=1 Tax=Glaciecola punicea ACAM 611 TaxID=1121923 RepID=H5T7M3_9ALTE|nr:hypothetical protein GPUN_0146 [Glaciecola punicea ACAM 611]